MKFYKVKSSFAKNMMIRKLMANLEEVSPGMEGYYKLLYAINFGTEDIYVRIKDMESYGIDKSDFDYLKSKGILTEVNLSKNESISVVLRNMHRLDKRFHNKISKISIKNLEKAKTALENDPLREYKLGLNIKKARKVQLAHKKRRRGRLRKIIKEKYGELPKTISSPGIIELVNSNGDLRSRYPMNRNNFYMMLWSDSRIIGVEFNFKESYKISFRKHMEEDDYFKTKAIGRALNATMIREQLYDDNPKLKKKHLNAISKRVKKKHQTDPEFRKIAMNNLSKGAHGLWNKCNKDPKFREDTIDKITKQFKNRTEREIQKVNKRVDEVSIKVINPEFGDPFLAKPKKVQNILETEYKHMWGKYYAKSANPYRMIKEDLVRMRNSIPSPKSNTN